MSGSLNVSVLLSKLKRVTDWHTFGIHLQIPSYELDKIQLQFSISGVDRCKSEMFHLWLRTNPNACWVDVAVALEKLNEIVLANEIRQICPVVTGITAKTPSPNSNEEEELPMEKINVEFKKAGVKKFRKIENRFASLVNNVKGTLQERGVSPSKLHGFLEVLLKQKLAVSDLTISDIFNSIAPYYSFLNTSLLESIIDEFLEEDTFLQQQLDMYEGDLEEFTSTTKLIILKEISSTKQHEGMPFVVLKLAGCYLDVTIERFQMLVKHIFGKQSNALSDIRVEDGCICITWVTQESAVHSLISLAKKKLYFMKHVGILRLTIGDVTVITIEDREELNDINSVLITAVAAECFNAVKFLLSAGANVNYRAENGSTPLVVASLVLSSEISELLSKANADLNLPDARGLTPLMWACARGDAHIIGQLLQSGANPNIETSSGQTALLSVEFDDKRLEIFRLLLEAGAKINHQYEEGWSALMMACRNGCNDVVDLLLQYKADIELTQVGGTTALMIACMSDGSTQQIVSSLLNAQANTNVQDCEGYTALMLACQQQFTQAAGLLLKNGAQTDLQSEDGWTALMLACNDGGYEIVHLLLKYNANTELTLAGGTTALMIACMTDGSTGKHDQVISLLLNAQANANVQDSKGYTALMLACQHQFAQAVKILLANGAQTDQQSEDGWTALMLACNTKEISSPDHSIPLLLLSKGADTEIRNSYGSTALLVAANSLNLSAIRALLNAEADINAQDDTGSTALHLSTVRGSQAITEHLLSAGVDVMIADLSGNTAVSIALGLKQMSFYHHQIYQLMFKHAIKTMTPEEKVSVELSALIISDSNED